VAQFFVKGKLHRNVLPSYPSTCHSRAVLPRCKGVHRQEGWLPTCARIEEGRARVLLGCIAAAKVVEKDLTSYKASMLVDVRNCNHSCVRWDGPQSASGHLLSGSEESSKNLKLRFSADRSTRRNLLLTQQAALKRNA
jgi:hypothetical protein